MIHEALRLLREMLEIDDNSGSRRSTTFVRSIPDTPEIRVAVHETGHLLTAWGCSAVVQVVNASTLPHGNRDGGVLFKMRDPYESPEHWCMLVIQLAGLAAEGLVFGKSHGGAFADLKRARMHSRVLDDRGYRAESLDGPAIDFTKAFVPPPSASEHEILRHAYRKAREVIRQHGDLFHKCVMRLLSQRELSSAQLEEILGHRVHLALLRTMGSHTFIVSDGP